MPNSIAAVFDAKSCFRIASTVGLCMLLTACAATSREESMRAKTDLLGMSKSDLMNCAGIPHRTGKSDTGKEYLAYSSEKTVQVPSNTYSPGFYPSFGYSGHRRHFHNSFLIYGRPAEETRACTATFGLEKGKVVSLTYTLNDSDSLGMKQCYQIVKNCLPSEPE